uniref:Uncharacterized protein n=1 Tax=Timema cristinae TaxID=61476 RepID=A0A7R9GW17_TIMCR|nr:unnamed protein product [Timema cristinae]
MTSAHAAVEDEISPVSDQESFSSEDHHEVVSSTTPPTNHCTLVTKPSSISCQHRHSLTNTLQSIPTESCSSSIDVKIPVMTYSKPLSAPRLVSNSQELLSQPLTSENKKTCPSDITNCPPCFSPKQKNCTHKTEDISVAKVAVKALTPSTASEFSGSSDIAMTHKNHSDIYSSTQENSNGEHKKAVILESTDLLTDVSLDRFRISNSDDNGSKIEQNLNIKTNSVIKGVVSEGKLSGDVSKMCRIIGETKKITDTLMESSPRKMNINSKTITVFVKEKTDSQSIAEIATSSNISSKLESSTSTHNLETTIKNNLISIPDKPPTPKVIQRLFDEVPSPKVLLAQTHNIQSSPLPTENLTFQPDLRIDEWSSGSSLEMKQKTARIEMEKQTLYNLTPSTVCEEAETSDSKTMHTNMNAPDSSVTKRTSLSYHMPNSSICNQSPLSMAHQLASRVNVGFPTPTHCSRMFPQSRSLGIDPRPIYPNYPFSPYGSPSSSPRSTRRKSPLKESRRVSIDKSGNYLQLNQYRLMESIGQTLFNEYAVPPKGAGEAGEHPGCWAQMDAVPLILYDK